MSSPREVVADWMNLPAECDQTCIWDSVHDGELQSVESDLLARTLTIQFDVPQLRSFHKLADDVRFRFALEGVQSVRVLRWEIWPGKFPFSNTGTWEEQQERTSEYRKLWRQESESWRAFENKVNSDNSVVFTDGDVVSADDQLTLRLGVQMTDGEWYEVFIRAKKLILTRTDQQSFGLEEFLSLGSAIGKRMRSVPMNLTSSWR